MRSKVFELSVLQYEGNWIAYAHFIPNPLCSAWRVFGSETRAKAQVVVWQNQIDGAMVDECEAYYAEGRV